MVSSFQFWRFASTHLMRMVLSGMSATEDPVSAPWRGLLIPGKCLPSMPWALRSWSTKLGPCWFLMTVLEFATEWTAQTVLQRVLWHKFAPSESLKASSFCVERQVECPDLTMNNLIWCWQNWIHHWRCGLVNSFNQITPTAKWLDSGLVWPY